VLENPVKGKSAVGIQAFNEFIKDRTDIEKVILTIRDGLYLIRKM
jgi:caffeoyl-CoA O-methyltransferase